MRLLILLLLVILGLLQYRLWLGEGDLPEVWRLRQALQRQHQENQALQERNASLAAEVADLKHGLGAIEERARSDMGMIKKSETFYQIIIPSEPVGAERPTGPAQP